MSDFFETSPEAPLAARMRPQSLDDVVGQLQVLGDEAPLGQMRRAGTLSSIIFWGPAGVGKTTIARLLADEFGLYFQSVSAVFDGVSKLRQCFDEARMREQQTLLFVDEIHRFNKAQQDSFLPVVEEGLVILIGATTENPSFSLNNALLSRAQVLVLEALSLDALAILLSRAEEFLGDMLNLTEGARALLLERAHGDGRYLLNSVEHLARERADTPIDEATLQQRLAYRFASHDRKGDGHYDLISALHKSVRGSDADAALYWAARMLNAGDSPLYLLRRLIRMAYEDIGLADPNAANYAVSALRTYEMLGSPEGDLAIYSLVIYLALAPKSNAAYTAAKQVTRLARKTHHLSPPKEILNAPTAMMASLDYGKGYQYDHDSEAGFLPNRYFPEQMAEERLYMPVSRGFERDMQKRLAYFDKLRKAP